jgi:hypothetical protein
LPRDADFELDAETGGIRLTHVGGEGRGPCGGPVNDPFFFSQHGGSPKPICSRRPPGPERPQGAETPTPPWEAQPAAPTQREMEFPDPDPLDSVDGPVG